MRLLLAMTLGAFGVVMVPSPPALAVPGACPPICDAIPDVAWIAAPAIPLHPVYRWPELPALAVTAPSPQFGFEALCDSPPIPGDPRDYAVAARSVVLQPDGQWNLVVQILHWRGDTATGGELALSTLENATARLRDCQLTSPQTSPSVTTGEPDRLAAVISRAGDQVMRDYLLADPRNSTIVELAMWSSLPAQVPWPATPDSQLFDALAAPLCEAYLGSCR